MNHNLPPNAFRNKIIDKLYIFARLFSYDPLAITTILPRSKHHTFRLRKTKHVSIDKPKDRIYKGWELAPHEYPWMVKIKVKYENDMQY